MAVIYYIHNGLSDAKHKQEHHSLVIKPMFFNLGGGAHNVPGLSDLHIAFNIMAYKNITV